MKKKIYYLKGEEIPEIDEDKEMLVELEPKDYALVDVLDNLAFQIQKMREKI